MSYGDNYQLVDEFQRLVMAPDAGNSFTALLELPPNQAVELLHCETDELKRHRISPYSNSSLQAFPCPARYSVFATDESPSNSMKVKAEPLDSGGSNPNSSDPTAGSESEKEKPLKRKEREKKVINRIDLIILILSLIHI